MNQYISICSIFFKKNYFFDESNSKKIKLSFLLFLFISVLEFFSIGLLVVMVLTVLGYTNHFPEYLKFLSNFEKKTLLLFFIFFIFIKYFLQILFNYFERKVLRDLQIDYTSKLLNSYFFASNSSLAKFDHSVILNNLISEVKNVFTGFFRPANEFFSELIIILSLLCLLLFLIDFHLITIIIFIVIFFFIFLKIISKVANHWGKKKIIAGSELLSNIAGILKNYNIIKLLNKENFFLKKISPIFSVVAQAEFMEDIGQKLFRIFLEAAIFLIFLIALFFLISEKQDDLMTKIIQIFIPFLRILPSFIKLNTMLNKMMYVLPSVLNLQATSNELKNSTTKINIAKNKKINFLHSLEIKNLHFAYPEEKKIIDNKNFQFNKNEKYLIVGKSGSGKTTFVELLLGFKKANQGQFLIDSHNYEPTDDFCWKKLFGYVPQEVSLLNGSLISNIAFGESLNIINYEKMQATLNSMNLGGNFLLDHNIENFGSNISGGQKQRIGICRALYFDPEILILDEPTSALNIEDSKKIMKDILNLNKTIIVISHDQNIIPFFNNIINFE
jgi:ABC-type multidrug transport system fused ATPase/permease subunit